MKTKPVANTNPRYYHRAFLNNKEHEGIAFIEARVQRHADSEGLNAELIIGDCNRQVRLDFDMYGRDDLKNIQQKAQLLQDVVDSFCEAVLYESRKVREPA